MAVVYTEEFEAGLGAWTTTGSPSTGAAGARTGAAGLVIDTLAGSATQYIQRVLVGGTRVVSLRFYVNVNSQPVGSPTLAQGNCTAGDCKIALHSSGAIRVQVGAGTTQISSVLSAGWHRIDALFNTSAATSTVTWQVDGVTQTQATNVQTPTDMTAFRIGMASATTGRFYIDSLVYGDATGDYPFGASGGAPTTATAGHASATGSTPSVSQSELTAAPSFGTGTAAVLGGKAAARVSGGFPSGAGQAGSLVAKVASSASIGTGTGTALAPGRAVRFSPTVGTGTGTAYPATITAVSSPTGTVLTITMGVS